MDSSSSTTLSRLLSRLGHTLLSGTEDSRLRSSQYERQKAATNVEQARMLLLTIEKQSSAIKVPAQKQQTQSDLQRHRELIKRLNARLQELNELGDDEEEDESEEEEDEPNIFANYAPAHLNTQDGLDTSSSTNAPLLNSAPPPPPQTQDLRARRPLQSSDNRSAASTSARESLFAGRPTQPATVSSLSQSETLLSHNRSEQENLTTGLLGLAQALKASSQQFSQSLAEEKEVLKRAEGGLDKSAQGMEAAERRMGMLRKMSEGQGWWGRIKLYGFIFALWVGCFLIVFIGPKLRF